MYRNENSLKINTDSNERFNYGVKQSSVMDIVSIITKVNPFTYAHCITIEIRSFVSYFYFISFHFICLWSENFNKSLLVHFDRIAGGMTTKRHIKQMCVVLFSSKEFPMMEIRVNGLIWISYWSIGCVVG